MCLDIRSMSYGGDPVLGRLRVSVPPGETLAIVGPSGVGKSTLLRIMAGLETRFYGARRAPARIALVFQEPTLLPWRDAVQNICLPTGATAEAAQDLLVDVGLAGLGARFPGQMSLGQQRRLALARAFAAKPEIMLLDEPFVSLDPVRAAEMMTLFERLRAASGIAAVLVTHAEAEAERLAARILTLGGTPATVVGERVGRAQVRA